MQTEPVSTGEQEVKQERGERAKNPTITNTRVDEMLTKNQIATIEAMPVDGFHKHNVIVKTRKTGKKAIYLQTSSLRYGCNNHAYWKSESVLLKLVDTDEDARLIHKQVSDIFIATFARVNTPEKK